MGGRVTRLWFIVPAHGRFELARVCLRQLRRTCDELDGRGFDTSAVVVADDENLDTALELGFATVRRENEPLGRKWNDAYQLACDPDVNPAPADFVIPLGSDDWIDPEFVCGPMPGPGQVRCARRSAIVREDGRRLQPLSIGYDGGDGVRVFPRSLLAATSYRPAEEHRGRAIDTSVFRRLKQANGGMPELVYWDLHPLQIVDFKSDSGQLNDYASCRVHADGPEDREPWRRLSEFYSPAAIHEMRELLERRLVTA